MLEHNRLFTKNKTSFICERNYRSIPAILSVSNMSRRSTVLLFLVFLSAAINREIFYTFAGISCPKFVAIERNTDGTVFCDTPGRDINFFWYRGDPSSTYPILRLEDGKPSGTEYGNGHFNISTSGAMIISDANLEHEGLYTFLAYFKDETVQSKSILVIITVKPSLLCPKIDVCNGCGNCSLKINGTGHLTCSVIGVRPNVTLKWVIKEQFGVSFVQHTSISYQNVDTDTWSTSTKLSYEPFLCNLKANMECVAQDEFSLLDDSLTSIRLHQEDSEHCTNPTADTRSSDTDVKILAIAVSATMVVLVGSVILACFIWKMRNRSSALKEIASFNEDEYLKLTTEHASISPPSSQLKSIMMDLDKKFLHYLQNMYQSHCFVQPLPWGNSIPVSALYTGCQCQIKDADGNTWCTSSDKLYLFEHTKNRNFVLIQGDKGYGKTIFCKYFVQRWIDDKEKQFLPFFISMKDTTGDQALVDTIKNTLFQGNDDFTTMDIENVLTKFKSVLLLDGLNEMWFSHGEESEDQEDVRSEGRLTIRALLRGETGGLKNNIQVWILSRQEDDNLNAFQQSSAVRIEFMSFRETEGKEYTMKVCLHYNKIDVTGGNEQCSTNEEANNTVCGELNKAERKIEAYEEKESLFKEYREEADRTTSPISQDSVYSYVCNFLEKYSIFKDFGKTPDLLVLIIHMLVAKSKCIFTYLNRTKIENLADLIDTVIMCLEAQYAANSNKFYVLGEWNALRKELEKAAFQLTFNRGTASGEDLRLPSKMWEEAMLIGILLQPNSAEKKSDNSGESISFIHRRFQEYFAVQSMVMNRDNFETLLTELKRIGRDEIVPILKFVSCLEKSAFEELCEFLLSSEFYNSFINCLHERSDHEETRRILKKLCDRGKISVGHLKRKDHREAVEDLFESCQEMKIKLGLLSFWKDCNVTNLTSLALPRVDVLELIGMALSPDDFKRLILHLIENKVTYELRLVHCAVPEDMSGQPLLEQLRNTKLNVTRKGDIRDVFTECFNNNTGKWEKRIWDIFSKEGINPLNAVDDANVT